MDGRYDFDAVQSWEISQHGYMRAIVDHNEAPYHLQRALAWPAGSM